MEKLYYMYFLYFHNAIIKRKDYDINKKKINSLSKEIFDRM